jgi:tripartite-type tricarboxylate transporter receptor subunit TctC
VPLVLEVHPSVPTRSLTEFIAYSRANPGRLNMASSGNGSPAHVAGELFAMMTGLKFSHIPYRGDAPAIADLVGGQVQLYFGFLPASLEHIRAGRLRALGVTTASKLEALPNVPAIAEFVAGYEATSWNGIGAPARTPQAVIELLDREINAALSDLTVRARFAAMGAVVDGCSAAEFKRFLAEEIDKWAKVIRHAGVKAQE